MHDTIDTILAKLGNKDAAERAFLQNAKRLYAKALNESRNSVQPGAGVQNSIETLPDGRKYVKADRQVIFGNDPESWSEQLEEYINGKIRRGENVTLIAEDGDELTLTARTAGKVASMYDSNGNQLSDEIFATKVNAGTHIDELAEVSKRGAKNAGDEGGIHGAEAKDGWNYRTAYFQDFDKKYYRVTISVQVGSDGNAVYNIGKMRERSLPTYSGSSASGGAQMQETSFENSISTLDGKSNPQNENIQNSVSRVEDDAEGYMDSLAALMDDEQGNSVDNDTDQVIVDKMWQGVFDKAQHIAGRLKITPEDMLLEGKRKKPGIKATIENARSFLMRKFVDSGDAVRQIAKKVKDKYLYPFYNMARSATNAGVEMIEGSRSDIRGNKTGEGLNQVLANVRSKGEDYYREFQLFLLHRHNVDRMSRESQNDPECHRDKGAGAVDEADCEVCSVWTCSGVRQQILPWG